MVIFVFNKLDSEVYSDGAMILVFESAVTISSDDGCFADPHGSYYYHFENVIVVLS